MGLILLFIVCPFLNLIVFLFTYLFKKNTRGILYSILIGTTLGLAAYYFVPPNDYDLYRHHLIVNSLSQIKFSKFLLISNKIDLEILPLFYSYIISKIGNIDLLQFFVVSIGYSILFYLLYDYRKRTNLNNINFIVILLFTIFGFHALYFISGLYCYIAIIIFSLAFYNEYVRNGNKKISYLLYLSTLFIHNSMFFAVFILIVYKLFKDKINIKSLVICLGIVIFATYILQYLNSIIDFQILKTITNMYTNYIERNNSMKKFYSGTVLFIEVSKLIITLLCIFLQKERKKSKGINGFIILLSLCTILMIPRSRVMIRFVMLIQFLGIVPIMDYFKSKNKNRIFIFTIITVLSMIYILYFYRLFYNQNFSNLFSEKIFRNIFDIIRK